MATVTIIRTSVTTNNYFGYVIAQGKSISWISETFDGALDPGSYSIPTGQQDNLDWFNDNGFKIDQFGRLHIGRMMEEVMPDTVIII